MNRALFLDRDGVINEDYGYVHTTDRFDFREGIFDICYAAQKVGMKIVVITNQAGIGKGYYTYSDFQIVTAYMLSEFQARGIEITGVYHCPYHTLGQGVYRCYSYDRKPSPGMLVKACSDHNLNPFHSVMVGDKPSDLEASTRIGIRVFIDSSKTDWAAACLMAIAS